MRYLVISKGNSPLLTNWFDVENHWNSGIVMVVDLGQQVYTEDGIEWLSLDVDHL